jgi:predicted enzyme related to lactoylglutathione lyase
MGITSAHRKEAGMDKVVHFEIPTDDPARAREFYGSIFDWDVEEVPDMQYTSLRTVPVDENQMPTQPGAINGGMYKRSNQSPPTPVVTIGVDSIDDALKKIEAGGGETITPRTPIEGMGAFAYFKDTEGNTLGLWETSPR